MLPRAVGSVFLTIPLFLGACLDDSGGDTAFVPPGDPQTKFAYSVSGETLIIQGSKRSISYCLLDSLVTDSSSGKPDTARFSIVGDTLNIIPDPDTLDGGIVIQETFQMLRHSAGRGIEGVWKTGPVRYRHLSGLLDPDRKAELDSEYAWNTEDAEYMYTYSEFKAGTLNQYAVYDWGEKFMRDWNRDRGTLLPVTRSRIAVEAKRVDKHVVELNGKISGETVRVTFLDDFDRGYTSNLPEHPGTWFRMNPTSCPNDVYPPWFPEFLVANQKEVPMAKSAAGAVGAARSLHAGQHPSLPGLKMPLWPK